MKRLIIIAILFILTACEWGCEEPCSPVVTPTPDVVTPVSPPPAP